MSRKRKITVTVSNDLITDQRMERICDSLMSQDFDVVLIGRELSNSMEINRPYKTLRLKLKHLNGPMFYWSLNRRLLGVLKFEKPDVLLANDLDTLLANYIYHRYYNKNTRLVYDSHEYFTEVPELIGRPARRVWLALEKWMLPKVKYCYTVSESIAKTYNSRYGLEMGVVRNLPKLNSKKTPTKELVGKKKLIYQGVINVNRGIELMVEMMKYLPDYHLYIFGNGDIKDDIKGLVSNMELKGRVTLMGRLKPEELRSYTAQCDLGLSFEEDMGLNYRYALPNKIFDYIHAEVPILVADLPEMGKIVSNYGVGEVIHKRTAEDIAIQIKSICDNQEIHESYRAECIKVKNVLCWEEEEKKLVEYFN